MPPPFDPDLSRRALDLAARVHGGQVVPGSGFPYVVHLAKVAMEVLAATEGWPGRSRDLALACALLHDTVEDAPPGRRAAVRAALRADFGAAVARGVEALTKDDRLPRAARMPDSLRRLARQPAAVRLVKLADRVTNLEAPPPGWDLARRRAYRAEAEAILAALGDASPPLARRLRAKLRGYAAHCGAPRRGRSGRAAGRGQAS